MRFLYRGPFKFVFIFNGIVTRNRITCKFQWSIYYSYVPTVLVIEFRDRQTYFNELRCDDNIVLFVILWVQNLKKEPDSTIKPVCSICRGVRFGGVEYQASYKRDKEL